MTEAKVLTELDPEPEHVLAWRLSVLLKAGYSVRTAEKLAHNSYVDLHRAVFLRESNCDEELCIKILI